MAESPTGAEERTAYLGLGSNLGDRRAMLRSAVAAIDAIPNVRVDPNGIASLYETAPIGGPSDQPPYLNTAIRIHTTLHPEALLDALQLVEAGLGRVRGERWGPRRIDIDILLVETVHPRPPAGGRDERHAAVMMQSASLTLPHPRLHDRRFVLEPLAEIAATVTHPTIGATIGVLAAEGGSPRTTGSVRRVQGQAWARFTPG